MSDQDVAGIIRSIVKQRAAQRQIPLSRRMISVEPKLKDNYAVNRHDIRIQPDFVLYGTDPVAQVDRVLEAVQTFDRKLHENKAEKINEVKSNVLAWAGYLKRTLSRNEYIDFLDQLDPPLPSRNGHTELEAEGERLQDRGTHFNP
jgi:hypothetical protein